MPRIFLPSASTAEAFIQILLSTNLFPVLFAYALFFMSIAVVMLVAFETFFTDSMKSSTLARAFDPVTLILGFIYSIWITLYLKGYSNYPQKYYNCITSVQNYHGRFFTMFVPYAKCPPTRVVVAAARNNRRDAIDDKYARDHSKYNGGDDSSSNSSRHSHGNNKNNMKMDDETIEEIQQSLLKTRDAGLAIISYGYRLFSKEESDQLEGLDEEVEQIIKDERDDVLSIMDELQLYLVQHLKYLELIGYFNTGDINMLENDLNSIRSVYRDMGSSQKVIEPPIFMKIIFAIIMIYFILWLPYLQWLSFGVTATILVFPVVMLILTVLVIVREWLGDAFDRNRPISYMNFYEWRQSAYEKIVKHHLRAALCIANSNNNNNDSSNNNLSQLPFKKLVTVQTVNVRGAPSKITLTPSQASYFDSRSSAVFTPSSLSAAAVASFTVDV